MPAFTSFLNLYKPGGGSSGLILPDEVVDIDRINANMDVIDGFAAGWGEAAERNHQFYGPAAGKASVTGMKLGDTYQETDGSKLTWRYDGLLWKLFWGTQISFTPSWSNLTVGDGSVSAYYTVTGGTFTLFVSVTLGSTSSFAGDVTITNIPVDMEQAIGQGIYNDVGTGDFMLLGDKIGTNTLRISSQVADGTFVRRSILGDMVEASGDSFYLLVSGTVA